MPYTVDFNSVSTVGLESSPVAAALAGLRANEARYFKNKYDHVFTVEPAGSAKATVDWVHRILKEERDIECQSSRCHSVGTILDRDKDQRKALGHALDVGGKDRSGAPTTWVAPRRGTA
jgi:hypothetical protein